MMDDLISASDRKPGVNCPICKSAMTYTALLDTTKTSVMCVTDGCKLHFVDLPRAAAEELNKLINVHKNHE